MATIFCKTCHKAAFDLLTQDGNLRVTQKGKTLLTTKVGAVIKTRLCCPDGYPNKIEIGY